MSLLHLNEETFDNEVLEFDGVVVVDFWAEWCNPCKMLGPIFEKVANSFADNKNIKFAKVNVDDAQRLATKFNVMSIPTILFFKNGEIINQKVGVVNEAVLTSLVEDIL